MTREERPILVVDDELMIQRSLCRLIGQLGGRPICLGGTQEALSAIPTLSRPAVALIDQDLGDGKGEAVALALRARWPDIEIVMMSGRLPTRETRALLEQGTVASFLPKPWERDELAALLGGALQATVTGPITPLP